MRSIIAAMRKSGISSDDILKAIEHLQAEIDEQKAHQREKMRIKKREQREKNKSINNNNHVPETYGDNRGQSGQPETKSTPSSFPPSSPLLSSPTPPSNNPPISPQSSPPKKSEAANFVLPDWIKKTDWADFEEMRKKIKKPLTDRARCETIADLDRLRKKGHDPSLVLIESIKNSWQGVFELKGNHNASKHTNLRAIDHEAGTDGWKRTVD